MADAAIDNKMRLGPRHLIAGLAILAAIVILALPVPAGASAVTMRAASVTVFALGLYATGVIPGYYTSITYMLLAVLLAVAPQSVVFSGFHSSAVWLVFGGLVMGLGVRESGLGTRAVRAMLAYFPRSYFGTVAAVTYVGAAMGFVIPSAVGRVTLLVPIVLALAERIGFARGSSGRAGLVLAAAAGTTIPTFGILPANVPNMGLIGAAESAYGIHFEYGEYLALNFPVIGVIGLALIPILVSVRFADRPQPAEDDAAETGWTRDERVLLFVLLAAIALWATDFLHGISPAWVGMGAAVLLLMPRLGILPPTAIVQKLDLGPWLFVTGIISMGAVATEAGLGKLIAQHLLSVLPLIPGAGFSNFAAIVGLGIGVGTVTTLPAAPAVMSPLAEGIAAASGWPLKTVLLAQVPAWMAIPFPHLAPPVVAAIALSGVTIAQTMRFLFPYLLAVVLVILPLQYLWGRLLGFYP